MTDQHSAESLDPETILNAIRRRGSKGMTVKMLVAQVEDEHGLDRSDARRELRGALRELERSGQVVLGRGKRYFPAEASTLLPGRLRRQAGGRFVVDLDAADGPPVGIGPAGMRGAVHGDRVLIRLEKPRQRAREAGEREGVVVRVVERASTEIVGVWVAGDGRPHVRPLGQGQRFTVEVTDFKTEGEPADGELVAVSLDSVDSRSRRARGVLLERLGQPEDPAAVDRAVLRLYGIREGFPPEVLAEVEALPGEVEGPEIQGRWDLRDRPAITIDGETARDFDDAVSARAVDSDRIEVEVHIADVSHYVRPGTELDAEGRRRGTSVYLPGLCVPMLPEGLSNDLCSLREGVDRLTYTVRFRVDPAGDVSKVEVRDSVIRSRRRCTYTEVFEWLERPRSEWPDETADFADSLAALAEAADRLSRARRARGSLDFDLAEPVVLLDPEGRVTGVEPSARNRAHRLIEELMVAANSAVARRMLAVGQPTLHRVHDEPDPAKIDTLAEVVKELGFKLATEDGAATPAALQALLDQVEGKREEHLVSMLVLRSMARAIYSPDPRGHYALAADAYLHFTSPIRRYPDLVTHRMLRRYAAEGGTVEGEARDRVDRELKTLGMTCSAREQEAEKAERTAVQWKTALFLRDRVGEVFSGRISGVMGFGVFVELDEVFSDGLIHISDLEDDYYTFDEGRHRLVGERTGRTWRLGDPVKVRLVRVNLESFQVELAPVGVKPDRRAAEARDRGPKGRPGGRGDRSSKPRGRGQKPGPQSKNGSRGPKGRGGKAPRGSDRSKSRKR